MVSTSDYSTFAQSATDEIKDKEKRDTTGKKSWVRGAVKTRLILLLATVAIVGVAFTHTKGGSASRVETELESKAQSESDLVQRKGYRHGHGSHHSRSHHKHHSHHKSTVDNIANQSNAINESGTSLPASSSSPTVDSDTELITDSENITRPMRTDRPHIIMIIVDDLGSNDLGRDSSDLSFATPTLDSLAENGIQLTRYYTQSSCTPARAALLTGVYPAAMGMGYDTRGSFVSYSPYGVPLTFRMIPSYLKEYGYMTHMVGKWNIGHFEEEYLPHARGFDTALFFMTDSINYYNYSMMPRASNVSEIVDMLIGNTASPEPYIIPGINCTGVYSTKLFTDEATRIIGDFNVSDRAAPLFLYLAYQAVHTPHENPPQAWIDSDQIELLKRSQAPKLRQGFARTLMNFDKGVKRVLNSLEQNDMMENSVLVVFSDNGACPADGGSNWPNKGGKFDVYEGGVRVPAIVFSMLLPDDVRGTKFDGLFHVTDWMPTLLGLSGFNESVVTRFNGINQWPALKGAPDAAFRDEILLQCNSMEIDAGLTVSRMAFPFAHGALIYKDMKYVLNAGTTADWYPPTEAGIKNCSCGMQDGVLFGLYNLTNDPNERENLAFALPDVADYLRERLHGWYRREADPIWKPPEEMALNVWEETGHITPWHRPGAKGGTADESDAAI